MALRRVGQVPIGSQQREFHCRSESVSTVASVATCPERLHSASMRAVVQRVSGASVTVDGETVGRIGPGLVVLVGVGAADSSDDVVALSAKMAALRIFRDTDGKMNRSVVDVAGEVLVVSQFTLLADVRKGRRPSYAGAAAPELAERLVNELKERLDSLGIPVSTGTFGARMQVALINDGPVTIVIDTDQGKIT